MSCNQIVKDNKVVGYFCSTPIYKMSLNGREFIFEWHSYCGPMWLKKDLEPRKHPWPPEGHDYWKVIDKFQEMSEGEKEKHRI